MDKDRHPKRRTIRLQGYDYSQNGAYFVTICTHERQRLFGQPGVPRVNLEKSNVLTDGITKRHHRAGTFEPNVGAHPCVRPEQTILMHETDAEVLAPYHIGAHPCVRPEQTIAMVEIWLNKIETKYNGVWVDSYVIMPDHVHLILMIHREIDVAGAHAGAPLQNQMTNSGPSAQSITNMRSTLGDIVKWFKTMTTNAYMQGVRQGLCRPFDSHLWQRNYYERIIRGEDELYEMRRYIFENPIRWNLDGEEPF